METPIRRRRWPIYLAAAIAVLALAVTAGLFFLDALLLSRARAAAGELSRAWGRPVEVGEVKTKLVPYLGVRVGRVLIGPGQGEDLPLLELDRVEVRADLVGAVLSGGKKVVVHSAEVEGLRLNVVRLADGSTNLERFAKAAQRPESEPAAKAPAGQAPPDLSFLRVERAALTGGRIAFLDKATPGAKALAVEQIDVRVANLAVGQPLEVELRAAVLSSQPNLEAKLRAGPLPATLRPTPERLALKVQPIDLSPLAPFVPATVGFLGGRFQADLEVALGAAGGGSGSTALKGTLAARELRFRGQEGGRPLDVTLEADMEADAAAGDVRIGKLDLAVGPAGLAGHGKASGLLGKAPRIDGLEVVSRDLDLAALAAYYPPLRERLGGRIAGPIVLSLKGSGAADSAVLELRVDLGPARLSVPHQLAKAAGAPAVLTARIAGGGDAARLEASADLAGVDLRPGGSLAKAPGERLALSLAGRYRGGGAARRVDIDRAEILLPGDALSGKGHAEIGGAGGRRTVRFDLSLASERLDLDRLLLPAAPAASGAPTASGAPAAAKEAPPDPAAFAGLSGTVEARVKQVRVRKVELRNAVVQLKLEDDRLTIEQARVEGFGGEVTAAGTQVRLAHPDQPLKVMARLKNVDVGQVLALYTSHKVLSGRGDLEVDVAAVARGDIAKTMAGSMNGRLLEGTFQGKDLVAGVMAPLAGALPAGLAKKVADGGATSLGKELPFSVQVKDGLARLTKPLRVSTSRADLTVEGGGIRLDGGLDLPVQVALSPATIAALTGGKVRPTSAIPVTLRLVGPAWSPTLSDLSLGPAVKAIVQQAGAAALGKAVGGKLGEVLGGASGASPEAAGQGKAEAEAKARQAAEEAKAKAIQDAKKKMEGLFR